MWSEFLYLLCEIVLQIFLQIWMFSRLIDSQRLEGHSWETKEIDPRSDKGSTITIL